MLQRALLAPIRLMFPGLPNGFKLALQLRGFDMGRPLLPLDAAGEIGVFHSTAHRTLLVEKVAEGPGIMALSPRAKTQTH